MCKVHLRLPPQQDSIIRYQVDSTSIPAAPSRVMRPSVLRKNTDSSLQETQSQEVPVFRFTDTDTIYSESIFDRILIPQSGQLFNGHALQPVNPGPVSLTKRNADWFTLVLVFVVIGFTWIKAFYFKIFRQLVSAFFSNSIANQIVRDENILVQRASIIMSFIFYLTSSLFIYQVSVFFKWDYPFLSEGILRFLVICLIVAFTYSFKMVLLKGLGEVFNIDKPVATYIFNIFLINNMLGLLLLPVVITTAYVVTDSTWYALYTGVAIVIISFIYRMVRAFIIWIPLKGVSFFYLMLYFCTLEIAPLIIIVKLARG